MNTDPKFLFSNSFDDGTGRVSEVDLEAARAQGREEGMAIARQEAEQALANASAQILDRLVALEAVRAELEDKMSHQAVAVAVGLIRKLMPAFVERGGIGEIEAVLVDALRRVLEEPRVVFRVPDHMLDRLQAKLGDLARQATYSGEVVLIADDRMGGSDCLVEWADGGAERNTERLWAEVEEVLVRALDAPAAAQPDNVQPEPMANPALAQS